MLDAQGDKVAESRHLPYGGERWRWPEDSTFPTDYRFTGQRFVGLGGLYHMGARFYDSQLGRWISPDTIIPDPANPQSLNRFAYVRGNPVKFRDPNGHQACEAENDACWERRWYQAHGYEYLEGQWLYTGNYFFADKFILAETLVEIGLGYHQINQLTSFGFSDGSVSYSLVQRGHENELSRILGSFAFALDAVDFAITGSVAAAYTIEQIATAAVGGPSGALVGLLAGDGGYKLMNMGLLGVDSLALLSIAGADFASGMSGFDASAQQAWIGCDTLVSAATLSVSAGSTALPVAPGIYLSLAGDVVQMTYDFLRAAGILSGYSLQIQW